MISVRFIRISSLPVPDGVYFPRLLFMELYKRLPTMTIKAGIPRPSERPRIRPKLLDGAKYENKGS